MAIQISGTEVISNSRGLNNIASVDATTAASISAAGVGGGGTVDFTADGAISAGDVVVLNSDGTVSTVTQTSTPLTEATSGSLTSASQITNHTGGVYDSTNQTVIITYGYGSTGYLTVVIGTVGSGNTITLGTPIVASTVSGSVQGNRTSAAYDPVNNKVVILASYGNALRAIAGTPSSSSISFGSIHTIYSGTPRREDFSICFDPDTSKFIAFFNDQDNSFTARSSVLSLSGTSLSSSTPTQMSGTASGTSCSNFANVIYDENINRVVFVYDRAARVRYVLGTVSGSSISYSSEGTITSSYFQANNKWLSFDSSTNKVFFTYYASANSYARVLTFTTSSVSAGSQTQVSTTSVSSLGTYHAYDSTSNNFPIVYQSNTSPYPYYIRVATISGTTISLNTTHVLQSSPSTDYKMNLPIPELSAGKVVTFASITNSAANNGAIVSTTATLSSDNDDWIGISTEAIADTATGTVTVIGGVNDQQSGLTAGSVYYVGNDGSLSTSTSGVKIGKALAATDLLITEGNT
jgi:hypothetical protein